MSQMSSWQDVKDRARRIDPDRESPERVADRGRIRKELLSRIDGSRLAEIRRTCITGLGGQVDVVARVGTVRLDIA